MVYHGDVKGYLQVKDAAAMPDAPSERALRAALKRQTLAGEKVGTTWLIEEAALRAYITRTQGKPGWPKGRPRPPRRPASEEQP